jgi:hypothetical protein
MRRAGFGASRSEVDVPSSTVQPFTVTSSLCKRARWVQIRSGTALCASALFAAVRTAVENLGWFSTRAVIEYQFPDIGKVLFVGPAGRRAVPIAGDDDAKRAVIDLIDQIGFTGVDAGSLAKSRRLQPGSPRYLAYADSRRRRTVLTSARVREFLAADGGPS